MLAKMLRKYMLITLTTAAAVGCAPKHQSVITPHVDPSLMLPPCQLLAPSSDSDADLAADVQNAECVRQLRLRVFRLQDWVRNATGLPTIK